MKLTSVDLKGYGQFLKSPAGFKIKKYLIPSDWDYIYSNPKVLLRIKNNGTGYIQADPPGGWGFFKIEKYQKLSI